MGPPVVKVAKVEDLEDVNLYLFDDRLLSSSIY